MTDRGIPTPKADADRVGHVERRYRVGEIKAMLSRLDGPLLHIPDHGGHRISRVVVQNVYAEWEPRLVVAHPDRLAGIATSTLLVPVDDNGEGSPGVERRVHSFALSTDPFSTRLLDDGEVSSLVDYLRNPEDHADLIGPLADLTPDETEIIARRIARRSMADNS